MYYSAVDKFQSPLPIRGETTRYTTSPETAHNFNPLSPYGERHCGATLARADTTISIPSPHTGRDIFNTIMGENMYKFQSPLPIRGETGVRNSASAYYQHFNPLSPYGERQQTHTAFQQEKLSHLHNTEANSAAGSFFLPGKICFFKEIRSFFRASRTEKGWELLPRTGYEEHQIISSPSAS